MRDLTRNIIRYVVESLLILIVLVFLARTGNMPVVVPERITDFIIDTTSQLFSGRVFKSVSGLLDDVGDLFLTGGTDRANKKQYTACKRVVERYFEQLANNLNQITVNPKVRSALPDFGGTYSGLYASDYLQNIVDNYYDLDQLILFTSTGKKIVAVVDSKAVPIEESLLKLSLLKKSIGVRTPILLPLKGGRFVLITSFRSKGREKYGYIAMVINGNELQRILARENDTSEKYFYIADRGRVSVVSSKKATSYHEFDKRILTGQVSLEILKEQKYISVAAGTRRTYLAPLSSFNGQLYLGYLGPEGSILIFILLLFRFLLLVVSIWVIIFLIKKIYFKMMQLVRERRLTNQLLTLSLEKSVEAGQLANKAAQEAFKVAKKASALVEEGVAEATKLAKPVVVHKRGNYDLGALPPVSMDELLLEEKQDKQKKKDKKLRRKNGKLKRRKKRSQAATTSQKKADKKRGKSGHLQIETRDGFKMEFDMPDDS